MPATARPGTPFPSDMAAYMPMGGPSTYYTTRQSPHSLHYALPELPSPTPPSLLKRNRSSGSSRGPTAAKPADHRRRRDSPAFELPSTFTLTLPTHLARRRESAHSVSSSCSSVSDGSEPRTPVLRHQPEPPAEIAEDDDENDADSEFDLDEEAHRGGALFPSSLGRHDSPVKRLSSAEAYTHASTRTPAPRPAWQAPTSPRPRLIRRGTPRPAQTLSSLGMTVRSGEDRRYISMIDGGAWLIRA